MKKFAFLFVAVSAISFASCGNKTQEATEATDSVDTCVCDTDTCACDSACVCDSTVAE